MFEVLRYKGYIGIANNALALIPSIAKELISPDGGLKVEREEASEVDV